MTLEPGENNDYQPNRCYLKRCVNTTHAITSIKFNKTNAWWVAKTASTERMLRTWSGHPRVTVKLTASH